MLFNSTQFLIFLPIVVLIYFIIPNKIKYLWLLVASYYFYMCWNAKYAVLILFSTVITYLSGICIEKVKNSNLDPSKLIRAKKLIVFASFFLNLSVLFYFKYSNFTLETIEKLLTIANIQLVVPRFDVLLPVGISFYTFQALGYTMDVYRDEIKAEVNFFRYALFVSFFPQLVAGPIERSKDLLTQLAKPARFNYNAARKGILLMLWGFFLKIVIADRIGIFVDTVYGDYVTYPGAYLAVASLLFAIQIYCDFYGYSTIAVGTAQILGIQLRDNFNAPYLSTSVQEFWGKWHISLTSWFKDYLYIPLGGSRKGTTRKYINKMIVFLTSGLWHGAATTFIAWGALNGIFQIVGEAIQPLRDKVVSVLCLDRNTLAHKITKGIITFILVDLTWIFFRAQGMGDAAAIFSSIFTTFNPWILFDGSLYTCGVDSKNFILLMICILVLLFADIAKRRQIKVHEVILKQDCWFRIIFVVFAVCFIMLFGVWGPSFDSANFIYFQF